MWWIILWSHINASTFSIISWQVDDAGSWNPSWWNARIHLSEIINACIMGSDGLMTQGARASAAMLLTYRKISNIRRTRFQNLNDSHFILQFSPPNPLKPGAPTTSESSTILLPVKVSYIRGLTVLVIGLSTRMVNSLWPRDAIWWHRSG